MECAAACDLYDGRHTLAREIVRPDLPMTRRYQELLDNKDIDCIVAAVPDHWHKQVVVDAVSAGKDIYIEKPMSHTAAEGVEMVEAAKKAGRIVQMGSQRVSSVICAKAKELVAQGVLGDIMLVEGWLGRNDPTGAWEYPPPTDLSPQTLDWDTWQGTVPKRPFDPLIFARWRCWKEYGTGVAGDLLVHLVSGMMYVLGINEAPKRAMAMGGILRWKDGRNMPDVHARVQVRRNSGLHAIESGHGDAGDLSLPGFERHSGNDRIRPDLHSPDRHRYRSQLLRIGLSRAMREEYVKKWHQEHDAKPGKEPALEGINYRSASWDDVRPHLWNFFQAVRPAGRWWRMPSLAITPRWRATWRTNRTSARPR